MAKGMVEGEWIHPDAASVEQIVAIAESCPSGAITYRRRDGRPDEAPPVINTVRIRENGPLAARDGPLVVTPQPNGNLKLEGNVEIVTGTGHTVYRATKVWLCRCGQSATKPWCDNTHKRIGFMA